jgi:hypothetical protein
MKVFFDNCTSPVLASTLDGFIRHEGHEAWHIGDLPCGRNASDVEWIALLSAAPDDWIVVSGDGRFRRNKAERVAYRRAGLRGFVLAPAYQTTAMNRCASILLWRWPDMMALMRIVGGAALYELPINKNTKLKPLSF